MLNHWIHVIIFLAQSRREDELYQNSADVIKRRNHWIDFVLQDVKLTPGVINDVVSKQHSHYHIPVRGVAVSNSNYYGTLLVDWFHESTEWLSNLEHTEPSIDDSNLRYIFRGVVSCMFHCKFKM